MLVIASLVPNKMKTFMSALHLGFMVVFMILSCTGIGYLADQWLAITPIGIVIGVFSGTILAFAYLYQMTKV